LLREFLQQGSFADAGFASNEGNTATSLGGSVEPLR
jgi:hypothetical protein